MENSPAKLFLDASCIKKIKSIKIKITIIWTKVTSRQLSNQSDTPRRKLSNIFILPILGKYCKFYQYWAGLRRKAICRSQKLRQHILSIAFLSLLMSSAVRNCPWFMMFYLSHLHDDILHLFPAAAVYTNFMMTLSTCFQLHVRPATMGRVWRWSQQLGHGEASCSGGYEAQVYSELCDRVWGSFLFLLFSSFLKIDQAW